MKKLMLLLSLAFVFAVAVTSKIRLSGNGIKQPAPIGATAETSPAAFYKGERLKKG